AFAREAITHIIHTLESDGHEVVYSDTDSVFVRSPEATLEGARRFGEQISQRFTQAGVTFEFQSVYSAFFSHGAKKRYVARQVWPKEEMIVRGYETRRTDAFDYQSSALQEIFERVLAEDIDGLLRRSRELVAAVRNRQVPPSSWSSPGRSGPRSSTTNRPGRRCRSSGSSGSSRRKGTTSSRA
ncbi:family B DNA polymerase, partial [mine drainage metagenome]